MDGFFEVSINAFKFGIFFKEPIWEHETAQIRIDIWMEQFLKAVFHLNSFPYCALFDLGGSGQWIEFSRVDKNVIVSLARCKIENAQLIETSPLSNPEYSDWKNEKIDYEQLKSEVTSVFDSFIKDLETLNPIFLSVSRFKELINLNSKIKT